MLEGLLLAAIFLGVFLLVAVVVGKGMRASRNVRNELRRHLEREGWSSIESPFFTLAPGFRGTWQGRTALATFQARNKYHPALLTIDVSTRLFERVRISRQISSLLLRTMNFSVGLPPRVELADDRFDARADSRELIGMILHDESTVKLIDEFLCTAEDRIELNRGRMTLRRELRDRESSGFSLSTEFRPTAKEVARTVVLAHRILDSLSRQGF